MGFAGIAGYGGIAWIADCSQDISLSYPCEVHAEDLLPPHDDYYLPSLQLEEDEGGDSTPRSHLIGGTFSFVKGTVLRDRFRKC